MTKKPDPAARTNLPSTPMMVILGGAFLCLALVVGIFAPGGFLDSLTSSQDVDTTIEDMLNHQADALPEALSAEKNAAFLAENAKKPGVKTTASGLQYRVIKAGPGSGKQPGPATEVTVHYAGTMIDGTEFDSSIKRGEPSTFTLDMVIPGWTEGVQLMHEGDKFEFVIPQDLAYAERGKGSIPPFQTLVFQIELIKVH
ncbi:MAG: FKBP-type peptidyl-prolyl cis-trans isomerase [Alphaproteobacteria bacterium]|nr:FKBP-type peptidyl-prolyl cis-trans isomerase [Alphaproteobacteria bacterium]